MTKIDELITKFKEFKEELNKNVNASYAPTPMTGTSGGQGGMYRAEKGEIAYDSMAMSHKEKLSLNKGGQWSLDKSGTNEKANPTHPHNKGKFKVMPMTSEKKSKKADVKGKPYTDDKVKKDEEHEEQRDQNKMRFAHKL